ncbi:MAG: hypothetical protein ABL964_14080 [Steroidobacteraceae bacterium]
MKSLHIPLLLLSWWTPALVPASAATPTTAPRLATTRLDDVTRVLETPPASEYEETVVALFGSLMQVTGLLSLCSEAVPDLQKASDAGFHAWREQQTSVKDIERHARTLILKNAGGQQALAQRVEAQWLAESIASSKQFYATQPPTTLPDMCQGFTGLLQGTFNLDSQQADALARLRSHPLP